jgi:hypothetical protein
MKTRILILAAGLSLLPTLALAQQRVGILPGGCVRPNVGKAALRAVGKAAFAAARRGPNVMNRKARSELIRQAGNVYRAMNQPGASATLVGNGRNHLSTLLKMTRSVQYAPGGSVEMFRLRSMMPVLHNKQLRFNVGAEQIGTSRSFVTMQRNGQGSGVQTVHGDQFSTASFQTIAQPRNVPPPNAR